MQTELHEIDKARAFYDDRYEDGYMDEWPPELKARIAEVIGDIDLPDSGRAIDIGCGNGVLTALVKQLLPNWEVWGTDISSVAIGNARRRVPQCRFALFDEASPPAGQFDFVFSHHVLEHVSDIRATWQQMANLAKPQATMLHILPCGNRDSFEHRLCGLRRDGIDAATGQRYFFEDAGHLRRLDTQTMQALADVHGFHLTRDYYRNQFYGAVEWITASGSRFVRDLTSLKQADSKASAARLLALRLWLLPLTKIRSLGKMRNKKRSWARTLVNVLKKSLFTVCYPVDWYIRHRADREWKSRRREPNGSEMFLVFERSPEFCVRSGVA